MDVIPFAELQNQLAGSLSKRLQDLATGDESVQNRNLSVAILGLLGYKACQFLANFPDSSKVARNPNRRGRPKHKVNVFSSWKHKAMNKDSATQVLTGIIEFLRCNLAVALFECTQLSNQQRTFQALAGQLERRRTTLQHYLWSLACIFKGSSVDGKKIILGESAVVPSIEVRLAFPALSFVIVQPHGVDCCIC
jgi:hypothetical protein